MADVTRDLRVDFLKLVPLRDFETSSRAVKKLQGATLSCIQLHVKKMKVLQHSILWILSSRPTKKNAMVIFYGFDVVFNHLIPLHEYVEYRICAKMSSPSSWYGSSGRGMVDCYGFRFRFTRQTSPNGTNESEGQFAEILFHKC